MISKKARCVLNLDFEEVMTWAPFGIVFANIKSNYGMILIFQGVWYNKLFINQSRILFNLL